MTLITAEMRAKATEIYHGEEICQAQFKRLLKEIGLPNGLLPLKDVEECGFIEETPQKGFVWMIQKKETKHKFEKIDRQVAYATEVTAQIEACKIKKLTGVKSKELLIWVTINEISVENPESDKIVFKTPTGLSRTFPVSAFIVDEPVTVEVKEVSKDDNKEEVVENVVNKVAVTNAVEEA